MAINAELKVYPSKEITAQDFAIMMEHITPDISGILYGCTATISNASTIHVEAGWCIVRGRLVKIDAGDITVTLPSSGSQTKYLVLTVALGNASSPAVVSVEDSVPSDSANFNVTSGTAYLQMASFAVTSSGASGISTSALMKISSNRIYSKGLYKTGLHGNNSGYGIYLGRCGNIVTCEFAYIGSIPKSSVNKYYTLGTGLIPLGYRPMHGLGDVRIPYLQVVAHSMAGSGRGQWVIRSNGDVYTESNTEGFIERIGNATWITNDDLPTS